MAAPNFPALGPIGEPGGDPAQPPKVDEPTELEKANARAERAEAGERDANTALRESVAQRTPPPAPVPAEIAPPEPGKMPDPSTQPAEFESWTAQKDAYNLHLAKQHTNSVRSSDSANTKSDRIIDDYLRLHPKYADLRNHVWQCYSAAAAELKLETLPDDTTTLDALVDKKMKHLVTEAAKATDTLPTGDPNIDEDPAQRTGGLSAGSEGGPAGGSPPKEDGEIVPVSLYDTMRNRQAKSGLF